MATYVDHSNQAKQCSWTKWLYQWLWTLCGVLWGEEYENFNSNK